MNNCKIIVPYSFSGEKGPYDLFCVECEEKHEDKSWEPDNNIIIIRNKIIALKQYFEKESENDSGREIALIPLEKDLKRNAELTANTTSVFLGIFLKASQEILHGKFKKDRDYIIATGDINPADSEGIIEPEYVKNIPEKFESVIELAEKNPEKKILFVCIHNEENPPFKNYYPENIEVKVFTKDDTLGDISAYIFKPVFKSEQISFLGCCATDINRCEDNNFIETAAYKKIKKEARYDEWNGCFIHGHGESGKSRMALELVYWLVETKRKYAPIWIEINNDNLQKFEISGRKHNYFTGNGMKIIRYNEPVTAYLAFFVADKLGIKDIDWQLEESLNELQKELNKHKYILVIDNLECELVDEVLKALKIIVSKCDPKPSVIVTSRTEKRSVFLELKQVQPSELFWEDVEKLVDNAAKMNNLEEKIAKKKGTREYNDFITQIHKHFSSFPGIIEVIVPLLLDKEMADLQPVLLSLDDTNDKVVCIFENALSNLDEYTQAVLFSFINNKELEEKPENESRMSITNMIYQNIISSGIILQDDTGNVLSDIKIKGKIESALKELAKRHLIYRKETPSGKLKYEIKSLAFVSFMFNPKLCGKKVLAKKAKSKLSVRDCLLDPVKMVKTGLIINHPAYMLEPFLKSLYKTNRKLVKKAFDKEYFLHTAAVYSQKSTTFKSLLKYDKNINRSYKESFSVTPLHIASAFNRNFKIIKYLVENGAKTDVKDIEGLTPLHYAAGGNKNHKIIEYLLEKNISIINEQDFEGNTPLHYAAFDNTNPEVVDKLLEKKAKYDVKNNVGYTPAHLAASDINILNCFVKKRNALFLDDYYGRTALHYLVRNVQDLSIIQWLKENEIDINGIYGWRKIPILFAAALNENEPVFKAFFEASKRIDVTDIEGSTIMHYLAQNPKLHLWNDDIIQILIKKGFDVNAVNFLGRTPLHYAAAGNSSSDSLSHFLKKGAKNAVNSKDYFGYTPLHLAIVKNEEIDVIIELLKKGALINEPFSFNKDNLQLIKNTECCEQYKEEIFNTFEDAGTTANYSPLHFAARFSNNKKVIKLLIDNGANIKAVSSNGDTPLHVAVICNKNAEIAKTLLDKDADFEAVDCLGLTPLHLAAYSGSLEVLNVILEKKADIQKTNKDGDTPLHIAAKKDREQEIIITLINKNPSLINAKNNDGETPIHYLKKRKDWKPIKKAVKEAQKAAKNTK